MAYQPESASYDVGVYQLETTDPVQGGAGGVSNAPLLNLANRTAWLYQNLNNLLNGTTIPSTVAPLASPTFTGSPKAPTPALGDNTTLISTTAFVQATIGAVLSKSVAGGSNVTLSAVEAGNGIISLTGQLTANIAVILPASPTRTWLVLNKTTGAFTLTVKTAAGTGVAVTQGLQQVLASDGTNIIQATNDFPNAALTGVPTAPTASSGNNSTQIATTGFAFNLKNGLAAVNVAGGSNVNLTAAQYGCGILQLTGALTASINVVLPAQSGTWVVQNKTTGSFSLNLSSAGGGSTALVPQGQSVVAYSDGTNVILAGAASTSSFQRYSFTATAGKTVFNAPYTPGNLMVLVNGAVQDPADITATDGSSVTLTGYNGGAGCFLNDNVQILAFNSFTVANALPLSGGTMTGPIIHAGGDTGVTPTAGDSSTKLATTAFVSTSFAPLASPSLTGTPLAPTAGSGTNSTQIATTAFVQSYFAQLAGLSTQTFSVAAATAAAHATNLGQFTSVTNASGYQKLPNGLIIQWGQIIGTTTGGGSVSFPLAFPSQCFSVVASTSTSAYPCAVSGLSATAVTLAIGTSSSTNIFWVAFGK